MFDDYYILIPFENQNNNEYGLAIKVCKDEFHCKVYTINSTFNISKEIYRGRITELYSISAFIREKVGLYNFFWYEILKLTKNKELIKKELKRVEGEGLKEIILNFKEFVSPNEVPLDQIYLISNAKEIKEIYKWSKAIPKNIHEIYKKFFKKGDIKSFRKIYHLFKIKEDDKVYELLRRGYISKFKKICKNPNKEKIKIISNYWAEKGNMLLKKLENTLKLSQTKNQ